MEEPAQLGVQIADVAGGGWPAAAGVLAALLGRDRRGGAGAHVDVSMTEGALALLAMPLGMAWARGAPLERGRELLTGGAGCYGVYRTRDGRFVALGALEPKFFGAFCAAVGRPELAERQLDGGLREELEGIFAARTRDAWAAFAAEHDVCLAPVLEGDEPRADPQLAHRGAFVEVDTPWEGRTAAGVATPARLRGGEAPRRPAPRLGEDGAAVLEEAGFAPGEVAALRDAGVVGG